MEEEIYQFKAIITVAKYYNYDTSWGTYIFGTSEELPHCNEGSTPLDFGEDPDKRKRFFGSLTGKMQELTVGGEYMIKATIKFNPKFGYQYEPIAIYALIPQSEEQQLIFLQSIIPESIAKNLIDAYPNIVNDVANGTIKEIDYKKVKGVREATWKKIKDKIINNYLISDIISLLRPLGVTFTMIRKLLEDEPNPALLKEQLLENPYVLVKIRGLGFKKIDDLAKSLNPKIIKSPERLIAFTKYYFYELGESDGHTWVSKDIFLNEASNNVPECMEYIDWLLSNEEFIHKKGERISLKIYHDLEVKILQILLHKIKVGTNINISDATAKLAIEEAEEEQGFKYVKEQLDTIHNALNSTVALITGKAGTGKTSLMKAIIKAYLKAKYHITASALSAMASQRITEATGYPANTIHRTLGCTGANKFMYNKDNKMITDVAFLDEGSMVNAELFLNWLEAIGDNTRIIISGDYKQLPPIGYGNIFSDLIECLNNSHINELKKPMRQAQKSGILTDANMIRENKNPISEGVQPRIIHGELQDMYYMFRENRETLFNIAVKTYLKSVETEGIDNVVIAVPRKQGCLNSTLELNKKIQDLLLPDEKTTFDSPLITYKLGAKVMQTVNDYDKNIFNGEIGFITNISKTLNDEGKLVDCCQVTFEGVMGQKKVINYFKKDIAQLDLAYAMTTHKLQGAGRHTVIGIIDNTHYKLLDNCMLYTMLTRAKKRCLLLAEPQAFVKCIRTSHNKRNTWLSLYNNDGEYI